MLERLRSSLGAIVRPAASKGRASELIPYQGQSTGQLLALVPTHRHDMVVAAFVDGLTAKRERLGLDALSAEERVVLAVEAVERDVNSDGFDGLFRWSADLAPYFVSSLIAIGRPDVAELASQAIDALHLPGDVTPGAIRAALDNESDARDGRLERLDQRYYSLALNMADDVLRWVEAHRASIELPGKCSRTPSDEGTDACAGRRPGCVSGTGGYPIPRNGGAA